MSYHEVTLNHMPYKKHSVAFDSSNAAINCSCHKFDFMGILCSHALRIYNIKGILRIPDQYFLKRWSKNARSVIYEHICEGSKKAMSNGDDADILYRNAIMKSFYNLVLESQKHRETQQIMWKLLEVGVERVQQCLDNLNLDTNGVANENNLPLNEDNEDVMIFDPLLAKTKGMSSTRKKGHFEKRKRSTTTVKQNKGKQKGDQFCAVSSSVDEPSNIPNFMSIPSNVHYTLAAPSQEYHSSSWSFNTPSIPFTSMLQGISSCIHLSRGSCNYNWLPPNSILQDRQDAKKN